MADLKSTVAVVAGTVLLVAGATTAYQLSSGSEAVTTGLPPAPLVNVLSVGPDSIELDWGPQQPGELLAGVATTRSLVVKWGASKDTVHPIGLTYSVAKNGKTIITGLTGLSTKVGFTLAVRSFRICVKATNSTGKDSSPMCGTFTASSL